MAFSVSSGFIAKVRDKSAQIVRKFTIAGSDYSAHVTKWPSVSRSWDGIKANNATVEVANNEGAFNFFRLNPITLTNSCAIQIGVQYAASSSELITVFQGTVGYVDFEGGKASITLIDRLKLFGERVVGDDETPVSFVSSNHNPADLAWIVATSYGGFSSVSSTSNPDIDYAAWQEWRDIFADDSVFARAHFDGQKVSEALRKIARMTASSVFYEDGKLRFARFTAASSAPYSLSNYELSRVGLNIDDAKLINRQVVYAGYSVDSRQFGVVVDDVSTYSVNSYGLREQIEKDENFWYVSSAAAINLAQRIVNINRDPFQNFRVRTAGLQALGRQVGDTISLSYDFLSMSGEALRIMEHTVDMNKLECDLTINASQLRTFFILDDSVLGVLDGTDNVLG